MKIREEIGKVIWDIPYTNAYTVQNYTDTITDIVSIFEKIIDDRMNQVKKEYFGLDTALTNKIDELEKIKELLE